MLRRRFIEGWFSGGEPKDPNRIEKVSEVRYSHKSRKATITYRDVKAGHDVTREFGNVAQVHVVTPIEALLAKEQSVVKYDGDGVASIRRIDKDLIITVEVPSGV